MSHSKRLRGQELLALIAANAAAPSFVFAAEGHGAGLHHYAVNFIIYVALATYLYKRFGALLLRARKAGLVEHLQRAGADLREAEQVVSQLRGRLSHINAEEEAVLKTFDAEARRMSEMVRQNSERQVEKLIEDTESQIQHELRRATQEIRREVVLEATTQAMAELQRGLSADADRKLRKDALNLLLAN